MSVESRLLWRCRRGIREMDLLLEQFLADTFPRLNEKDKEYFELFLEEADLDIYSWIMGRSSPENPAYQKFITHLQQLNQNSDKTSL